jgi:hypothetical protein
MECNDAGPWRVRSGSVAWVAFLRLAIAYSSAQLAFLALADVGLDRVAREAPSPAELAPGQFSRRGIGALAGDQLTLSIYDGERTSERRI